MAARKSVTRHGRSLFPYGLVTALKSRVTGDECVCRKQNGGLRYRFAISATESVFLAQQTVLLAPFSSFAYMVARKANG